MNFFDETINYVQDGMEDDGNSKTDVRYLFHEQLREKHRFLERSIHSQQQQLQQLQQKLIALATDGNTHAQLQMHLQRPLQRIMEIQVWFAICVQICIKIVLCF